MAKERDGNQHIDERQCRRIGPGITRFFVGIGNILWQGTHCK